MRVLEIGCGPGAAARAVAHRLGSGFVLAIDRSRKAIDAAIAGSRDEIAAGRLNFRWAPAEEFRLDESEEPFDMAFAIRVGAFDGRHPEAGRLAKARMRTALKPGAPFFIDGGHPLRRLVLDD